MKARASQTEASKEEAQRLVALPEKVEMHIALSQSVATEAELLDRFLDQQILALFEGVHEQEKK